MILYYDNSNNEHNNSTERRAVFKAHPKQGVGGSSQMTVLSQTSAAQRPPGVVEIHQRGVQWKQGVVICMLLSTSLLYNTTPIRLHLPPTAHPL